MHTVPFRLRENAQEFQAGEWTGFGIRTGVKHQDNKKVDHWTNYKAAVFAKTPAQIDFYRNNLVEGALVVVTAPNLSVEFYADKNGEQQHSIKMINANVVAVKADSSPVPAREANRNQKSNSAPQNQQDDFDSDIPF